MKLLKLPSYEQTYEYDCGAKAVQSILAYYGLDIKEERIMKAIGTSKNGTPAKRIIKFLKKEKLKCNALQGITIKEIKKAIDEGNPVLIVLQAWPGKNVKNWKRNQKDGHYVVAIGYDKKRIIFEDPYIFQKDYLRYDELDERWHDKVQDLGQTSHFGIIIHGRNQAKTLGKIVHMD